MADHPQTTGAPGPTIRDRIAAALLNRIKQAVVPTPQPWGGPVGSLMAATEYDLADAVLPVLPLADRAHVLREAIEKVEDPAERAKSPIGSGLGWESAREVLRRMLHQAVGEQIVASRRTRTVRQPGQAEEALDLSDGPVRCPLCPYPVTLHTPNGARAHFTTVHPEERLVGTGPWPLLTNRPAAEETQDLASADNPTHLRWGLNDVLWGDDDTVTVMLSGPDLEAYWLELDAERAAVLREDLAGPGGDEQPAEPPVHIGGGANAENCPACKTSATPPPYPWMCPGPPSTEDEDAEEGDRA